jgi:hypothetical protein
MTSAETAKLDGLLARFGAGLAAADLPPGTAGDLLHYASTPDVRGRAIQTLCRAIDAARRSGKLGLASDCTDAPAYVGVCRHGQWARVMEIADPPSGLVIEAELMRLCAA